MTSPTDRQIAIQSLIGAIKMASMLADMEEPAQGAAVISVNMNALVVLGVSNEEIKESILTARFLDLSNVAVVKVGNDEPTIQP